MTPGSENYLLYYEEKKAMLRELVKLEQGCGRVSVCPSRDTCIQVLAICTLLELENQRKFIML